MKPEMELMLRFLLQRTARLRKSGLSDAQCKAIVKNTATKLVLDYGDKLKAHGVSEVQAIAAQLQLIADLYLEADAMAKKVAPENDGTSGALNSVK